MLLLCWGGDERGSEFAGSSRDVPVLGDGANTAEVLDRAAADNVMPRRTALAMAEARVRRAMGWRRWR